MGDKDTTENELDAPRAGTTNPMLERILEELLASRERDAEILAAVTALRGDCRVLDRKIMEIQREKIDQALELDDRVKSLEAELRSR